jgi:hypothetical protein
MRTLSTMRPIMLATTKAAGRETRKESPVWPPKINLCMT